MRETLEQKIQRLNAYREALLVKADLSGVIDSEMRQLLPGVHFCNDFDGLPIFDGSPEKVDCHCKYRMVK